MRNKYLIYNRIIYLVADIVQYDEWFCDIQNTTKEIIVSIGRITELNNKGIVGRKRKRVYHNLILTIPDNNEISDTELDSFYRSISSAVKGCVERLQ